jgi:hypothetical protein
MISDNCDSATCMKPEIKQILMKWKKIKENWEFDKNPWKLKFREKSKREKKRFDRRKWNTTWSWSEMRDSISWIKDRVWICDIGIEQNDGKWRVWWGFLLISFASFSRQYIFVDGMKLYFLLIQSEVKWWNVTIRRRDVYSKFHFTPSQLVKNFLTDFPY